MEPWNGWNLWLGSRPHLFSKCDRSSRLHVDVELEVLEAGHVDLDLVSAGLEPQRLERAVEVIDQSRVIAIHEHLRVARTDLQANAADVIAAQLPR